MGLQTLIEYATRPIQTILPTWFDDIRNILIGDWVGRDANGAPASGRNLGTLTYPWGTAYVNSLLIGGDALDTSQLESSPYKLVSGAVRSTSNQPDFIRASGSGVDFTVLAATTPIVLSIAGVAATWTLDKTVAGTAAPGSNNTATVNDSTAAAQAATRTWGEYGSGAPYYAITISSAGTEITSRVGTWQAFKIGTEYFLAYVESSTSLSRCFRGFFLDSAGAPVKRATFSNSATITLMSLGWVFLDADGSTVDTTYTNPTYAASAPGSPASGDYWFDQVNQVWKRYNGSSFVQVNRILAGLVVLDSTDCVASRSFDFFALDRSDNTIEVERISNTVVKGAGLFQRVTVRGKRFFFVTSRAAWDTASNLAASSERYNAAVTASTTEYLYVTDTGDTKISDFEPYFRADLLGWYHPHNTWRHIGNVGADGSAHFTASSVVGSAGALAANSVTAMMLSPVNRVESASSGAFLTSSASYSDVVTAPAIKTKGRPVRISFVSDGSSSGISDNSAASLDLKLFRDATQLLLVSLGSGTGNTFLPPGHLWDDEVPAGTYTYKLQARSSSGGLSVSITNCKLTVQES